MQLNAFNVIPGVAFLYDELGHVARDVIRNCDHEFVVIVTTEGLRILLDFCEEVVMLGIDPAAVEDLSYHVEDGNFGRQLWPEVRWARRPKFGYDEQLAKMREALKASAL